MYIISHIISYCKGKGEYVCFLSVICSSANAGSREKETEILLLKSSLARVIMTIECRNAKKRFCESIESTHPRFVLSK